MSLWDWALTAYAAEGVADACLELQDAAGQNIPLLLWAAWCAHTGRTPDEDALEAAGDTARAWQETAIAPLRAVRRALKARAPDLDRIPHWPAVIAGSVLAHGAVPDLWAVGWDWAITPDGAVLLEGNSGFGLGMPQLFGDAPLLRGLKRPRP